MTQAVTTTSLPPAALRQPAGDQRIGAAVAASAQKHEQLTREAQRLVSLTFFGAMLKQMHNSPFKSEVFSGGRGGEAFNQLLDQQLSDRMAGSKAGRRLVDSIVHRQERTAEQPASQDGKASTAPTTPINSAVGLNWPVGNVINRANRRNVNGVTVAQGLNWPADQVAKPVDSDAAKAIRPVSGQTWPAAHPGKRVRSGIEATPGLYWPGKQGVTTEQPKTLTLPSPGVPGEGDKGAPGDGEKAEGQVMNHVNTIG